MAGDRRVYLREDDVHLTDVRCGSTTRGWSLLQPAPVFGLVLLRDGVLRGRVDGVEHVVDAASVYVERPGTEQQFAHPQGPDTFTEIVLSEPRVADLLGGDPTVPEGLVMVTPELALAHRMLLSSARQGADSFELGEYTARLSAAVFARLAPARAASGRPASAAARRRLTDDARAVLAAEPTIGLEALGRTVGASPHHLSRVFTAVTGITLSAHRGRLRLARVLDRLSEGERDLAGLARELGYTDQSHMTRAVRRTAGLPPGRLRTLLTSSEAAVEAGVHAVADVHVITDGRGNRS
ncbi:AraC family transcriptional regulator [Streptomyces sp. NBC_01241]|uniref:helix-turn-helix domain-containing protein n=1 Tax=Streptomyces sp. NBC_01241 TaxID=2903794 RepID=UPI00352CE87C|nr:AraC family transcriptional regulator [Streptomyces sp. NBC_01241]